MKTSEDRSGTLDEKAIAAQRACVDHARDLLASGRVVHDAGRHNIAYHLAALTLEELGRRALIGVQCVARLATVPPAWPSKHTQDHVKKLFWCFLVAAVSQNRSLPEASKKWPGWPNGFTRRDSWVSMSITARTTSAIRARRSAKRKLNG